MRADRRPKIDSLTELIGGTPAVKLRRIPTEGGGDLWAKCEQYNPGGSVKDRIALAMIEAAEQRGLLTAGRSILVEPTSGNTGIGLALACVAKGYALILTMPESMSLERRALLKSYGAELVLTPAADDMGGSVARAKELVAERGDAAFMPDQFRNPANPEAHRRTTAVEILQQMEGRLDAFVAGIGTGGTITGVGRLLREKVPGARVIGIEPAGSAVLSGGPSAVHRIQGIGAGVIPPVLDRSVLDEVRTITDEEAWATAQELARREGLLVGISSGANVAVACQVARELGAGKRVVTVLADTGERYFSMGSKFV